MERSRFFEISRGSVIEIDACLDIVLKLGYLNLIVSAESPVSGTLRLQSTALFGNRVDLKDSFLKPQSLSLRGLCGDGRLIRHCALGDGD